MVSGAWPEGAIDGPAGVAQELARNLRAAIGARTIRQLARDADLRHSTVLALLNGQRWPDFVTIVKLEDALETRLWPDRFR